LDQKPGAKRDNGMFQPTWHCCMCCNPANGRVDFEDGWLIKSSFITQDEHEACQLTRTKVKKKSKKKSKKKVEKKEKKRTMFEILIFCIFQFLRYL
jgi:hypothetical protein